MKKKSKITVKHYLEKKVKPIEIRSQSIFLYPLYYRITYKRKTTNLKSFTGTVMTEKAYEHFKRTNTILNNETDFVENPYVGHRNLKVEKELFFIEKALEKIFFENEDLSTFDIDFIETLRSYFANLKNCFYYQGWRRYYRRIDEMKEYPPKKDVLSDEDIKFEEMYKNLDKFDEIKIYHLFNKEHSLIYSLNTLEDITGFDVFPYIHKDSIKLWHVIGLILLAYPETVFIDFFLNYDVNKIIKKNKGNKTVTNKEIKIISNYLRNSHLELPV